MSLHRGTHGAFSGEESGDAAGELCISSRQEFEQLFKIDVFSGDYRGEKLLASVRNGINMRALHPSVLSTQLSVYQRSKPTLLKQHLCVRLDPEGERRSRRERSGLERCSGGKETREPAWFSVVPEIY